MPGALFLVFIWLGYLLWSPGLDLRDGRHDRGHNGVWVAHGWLGGLDWFIKNGRTNQISHYQNSAQIRVLADRFRKHHIADIFPHLCPADADGRLPSVDAIQVERFLNEFDGFRVMPWVGGPNGTSVVLHNTKWRSAFVSSVQSLMKNHPRLAGIQLNIEPLPNGDTNFLRLLEELRTVLPKGKLLSVAAYPPPTRWHPYADVHWDEQYFHEVAKRSDQLAVMMYDAAQRIPKTYETLLAKWTQEALAWSDGASVLLGVPTYDDAGVGYHFPNVENLTNALRGIHRGLSRQPLPPNYQGIAIYCDWETTESEWKYFREHFLGRDGK